MKTLFAIVFFASSLAFAQKPLTSSTLSDGSYSGTNNIYGKIIPYADGTGFGFNYEKMKSQYLGFGGSLTFLPDKTNAGAVFPAPTVIPGLIAFMGNIYLHYPLEFMDFYVSPGLGLMMIEIGSEDETTIGAEIAWGALAQVNKSFGVGVEFSVFHPWFNDDVYTASRGFFFNSGITAKFTF